MEFIDFFLDLVLNIDQHLSELTQKYREGIYLILFIIIFVETGLVFMPFLPGDSLLFAAGALAGNAMYGLSLPLLILLLIVAAITGDYTNYLVGKHFGRKLTLKGWIKKKHMDTTTEFFRKYGRVTIIIGRFLPIIRTFAPFLAGLGKMPGQIFAAYNIIGGVLWILIFLLAGYFFGNLPLVKENFSIVVLAIIILSNIPLAVSIIRKKMPEKSEGRI